MWIGQKQRGDTLVEVLLAMSVIGMVIGGAYAIAGRNLRTGRVAREQSQALQLAEAQIEKIKHLTSTNDPNILNSTPPNNTFCISGSGLPVKILANSGAAYTSGCTGILGLYTILVTYTGQSPAGSNNDFFDVKVTWVREGVTEQGQVRLRYKVRS
jgi:prepilin-type N-terminal cleavage/methylation domain-containing protein